MCGKYPTLKPCPVECRFSKVNSQITAYCQKTDIALYKMK